MVLKPTLALASNVSTHFMKTVIYILFSILMISSCNANSKQIDFRDGDIIFHTSKSRQSKAIQLSTHSTLSHMGLIVTIDNDKSTIRLMFDNKRILKMKIEKDYFKNNIDELKSKIKINVA